MRWWLIALVACGGGGTKPDAAGNICVGGQDYIISPDCDDVNCHAMVCDTTCAMDTTCKHLDCSQSPQCRLDCQPGATCNVIDCQGASSCFVDCHGPGSTCEVQCENSPSCMVNCHEGAQCLIHCGGAGEPACGVDTCTGGTGLIDCGGGVTACNRPCP